MPAPSRAHNSRQVNEVTLKAVMYITKKNYTQSIRHEAEIYLYLHFYFCTNHRVCKTL